MRVATKIFGAVMLMCAVLGSVSSAETGVTVHLNDKWNEDTIGGVGDPLAIKQEAMIILGQTSQDNRRDLIPIVWRLNWADGTVMSTPVPGLLVDKSLRYSAAQSSVGLWLAGPSIALLRPDGRMLQAPLGAHQPPVVALVDGSLLVFKAGEQNKGPGNILSVRLTPDGNSLQVTPVALLTFDGLPYANEKPNRVPQYGYGVELLKDGRVLMFGGEYGTHKLASIFDPATASMTLVSPMPHERSKSASMRLSDGRVAVAGARSLRCYGGMEARTVDIYDVQANTWTTLPPLPLPLCAEAYGASKPSMAESSDGSLVLGGGLDQELLVLPRDSRSPTGFASGWKRVGWLPTPRIGGVVQALPGNRIVVAGGVHTFEPNSRCCKRTPGVDRISLTDSLAPAFAPSGLSMNGPGVALRGERLFVAGGRRFAMTDGGKMRYGSEAEVIDLKTGTATQLDAVPVVAGAMDAFWLDDDRVLVKGRLAASDRGFDENLASYMPDGSGAMAIYHFSTRNWTRVDMPELDNSRMLGVRDSMALLLAASGGLQTWRVGEAKPTPGSYTLSGSVGAIRMLPDGRVVLASNVAPSDFVSLLDEACDANPTCEEGFSGLGMISPARLYEVVKLGDPGFHIVVRDEQSAHDWSSVSHAIDMQGHVIRLSWMAKPDSSNETRTVGRVPGWNIERTRSVGGRTWESLPLPPTWRDESNPGKSECGSTSNGMIGRCQLLALPDPRDTSGKSTLLFLRSTNANSDWGYAGIGTTTVWWFNESAHRWDLALQIDGLQARYAMFEFPQALFPGMRRLRSIGWHLEQPILWVD